MKEAETLRDRLESRLAKVGMTQAELSRKVGISAQGVASWMERGAIPKNRIDAVCELLRCDPLWLNYGRQPNGVAIDPVALAAIVTEVFTTIDAAGLNWPIEQSSRLIANLYQVYSETGNLPDAPTAVRIEDLRREQA